MTIQIVDIAGANGTIGFGRQIVNQLAANINQILAISFVTTGNVTVQAPNGRYLSVNVSRGLIWANGAGLTSLRASEIVGKLTNQQLQNSSITVATSNGVFGGGAVSLGGSVSLNAAVIDSISNTRTTLPASANSAVWAQDSIRTTAANASIINVGILAVAVGGTGLANNYGNGDILVGTTGGALQANQVRSGVGIAATFGRGGFSLSANIAQGVNVALSYPDAIPGRIVISANAQPFGNTTQYGVIRLNDTNTSTSLTHAATPNAVNALYQQILSSAGGSVASANRLDVLTIYSTPGTYVWARNSRTAWIHVTVIGGGAGGRESNGAVGSVGAAGGSGAHVEFKIPLNRLTTKAQALGGADGNTLTIVIGDTSWGGNVSASPANGHAATFGVLPSGNLISASGGFRGNAAFSAANVSLLDNTYGLGGAFTIDGIVNTEDTSFSGGDQGWEWLLATQGQAGGKSISYSPNNIIAGTGGSVGIQGFISGTDLVYGRGGAGGILDADVATLANGESASGYGAGGGGCAGKTGIASGGAGGPAIVIVREYSSGG